MSVPFPSHAWVKALEEKLNTSAKYGDIAKNWEGDILFQIEFPDQSQKLLYLDLWHGKCRDAYEVTGAAPAATFVLAAPLANLVKIIKGDLDPIQAMVTGKLKVKGSMIVMMKNVPTVLEFVNTARQVDTEFPAA